MCEIKINPTVLTAEFVAALGVHGDVSKPQNVIIKFRRQPCWFRRAPPLRYSWKTTFLSSIPGTPYYFSQRPINSTFAPSAAAEHPATASHTHGRFIEKKTLYSRYMHVDQELITRQHNRSQGVSHSWVTNSVRVFAL